MIRPTIALLPMLLAATAGLSASAAADGVREAERGRWLMGTRCLVSVGHRDEARAAALAGAALDEIARWESILSDWDPRSELSRLNSAPPAPFACSPDLFQFLEAATDLARRTGGAFDITVGPLVELWDLRGAGRIPSPAGIARALESVGSGRILLDPLSRTARLAAGMRLDPGAIGKGWALDAAAGILRKGGAEWALLDFGGQILAVGSGPDGCGFPVRAAAGGRDVRDAPVLKLRDASASTSSNEERAVPAEGETIGHILDPRTGRPARGLAGVTVVAPGGALADALSTALFVAGADEGARLAEREQVAALFALLDPPGAMRAAGGFDRLLDRACPETGPATGSPSDATTEATGRAERAPASPIDKE